MEIESEVCCWCKKPIDDEFPTNYYVAMVDSGWAVHVHCYNAWNAAICAFDGDIGLPKRIKRVPARLKREE